MPQSIVEAVWKALPNGPATKAEVRNALEAVVPLLLKARYAQD
jgi:hypothetical protein